MASKLNQPVSDKTVAIVVGCIVVVALVCWGGFTWHKRTAMARPLATEEVKHSIWKFLSKQTGEKDFHAPLDIPTSAPGGVITVVTNSAGGVTTIRTVQTRRAGSAPSIYFRTNQEHAATYSEIYRFVGQQLDFAERLLTNHDTGQRSLALVMAREATAYTRTNAMNPWLSARICEAYLWPNLSLLDPTNRPPITMESVLNICDATFKEAGETNNIRRNYEFMVTKTRRPSESIRYRLARLYQDAGEDAKALEQLKQIKTYRMKQVEFEMGVLEKRLGARKQ
jgi:hypothetical protein